MTSTPHLPATASPRQSSQWIVMALIGLCALLAHCRSISFPFLSLDDQYVVTQNMVVLKGLTLEGLKYAFFDIGSDYNWIPVTRLSHMLDVQLYGDAAWGHHLTNILLHSANAMLIWFLLHTLTRSIWRSALAAVLFAVHPIHVESIAWIAERRDVLSLFMGLLGLIAYARYCQSIRRTQAVIWYVLAMLGCSFSMMSKPTMVTLPCAMLLLDFWPLQRLRVAWVSERCKTAMAGLVIEKLPLFGVTVLSAYLTMAGQYSGVSTAELMPLPLRLVNLPLMYVDYLVMGCWPVNILPLYADHFGWTLGRVILSIVVLLLISYAVARLYKRQPFLLMGWLWYLGTLVPMSGLVSVGYHTHASRFVYYPFLGIYIIVAWLSGIGYAAASSRLPESLVRKLSVVGTAIVVALCMAGSWVQSNIWSSDLALYESMAVIPNQTFNLMVGAKAIELMNQNRLDEAIEVLNRSSTYVTFGSTNTLDSLMSIRLKQHDLDHAENLGKMSIAWHMDSGRTWYLMGDIAMARNLPAVAVKHYAYALSLVPGTAEIYLSQHDALQSIGDEAGAAIALDNAMSRLQKRFQKPPDLLMPGDWYSLGQCYSKLGRLELALNAYRKAQEGELSSSPLFNSMGVVLARMGRLREAADAFNKAVEEDPANQSAISNLNTALQKLNGAGEAEPPHPPVDAPIPAPAN